MGKAALKGIRKLKFIEVSINADISNWEDVQHEIETAIYNANIFNNSDKSLDVEVLNVNRKFIKQNNEFIFEIFYKIKKGK